MAESTLSIHVGEIRTEVSDFLGLGRTFSSLTADDQNRVNRIIEVGLRQFYFPPALPGRAVNHEWSFLKPTTTLTLSAPHSTGTASVTEDSTTVTFSSATLPSWVASGVFKTSTSTTYEISTRDSSSQITLATAYTDSTDATATYEIFQESYDLPDNFGSLDGMMTYQPGVSSREILQTGEGVIRNLRMKHNGLTGRPERAAVRPSRTAPGVAGQRFVLELWPTPART